MIRKDNTSSEPTAPVLSKKVPDFLRKHDRVFILRGKLFQLDRSSLNVVYNHIRQKLVELGLLPAPLTKGERADLRAELEKSPWMNMECLEARHAKQVCFEEWKANPCQETANAWKAACDKLRGKLMKLRQFWIEKIDSVNYFQDYEDLPLADDVSIAPSTTPQLPRSPDGPCSQKPQLAFSESSQDFAPSRSESKYPVYPYTDKGGSLSIPSGTSSSLGAGRQSRERSRSPLATSRDNTEHQCSSHDGRRPPESSGRPRGCNQSQSYDERNGCISHLDSAGKYGCRQCGHHHYQHPSELATGEVQNLLGSDCSQYQYPIGPSRHLKAEYTCYKPTVERRESSEPGQSHSYATEGANECGQKRYEVYCPTSSSFSSVSYRQRPDLPPHAKDKKPVPRRCDVIISEYSRADGGPFLDK